MSNITRLQEGFASISFASTLIKLIEIKLEINGLSVYAQSIASFLSEINALKYNLYLKLDFPTCSAAQQKKI